MTRATLTIGALFALLASFGVASALGDAWRCFHTAITLSSFIRATILVTAG